ncbi:MAG: hypothetical protein B7O98_00390 [Zestosphaera tikiterensis]|uniref:Antitoxin n=1 Tax=Zestosphaera tikiterensis TaxID=1973259 RepID=A0A2R7Y8R2_9CREN|nr:MAG: hypothetical protein B7O98_00390 [Zestosphaera tikiterensis]
MSRVIRVRYEKGVFKPLEPVDLEEGEEVQIIIRSSELIDDKFYGIVRKHRPDIRREELLEVLEEIEDEGFRGH